MKSGWLVLTVTSPSVLNRPFTATSPTAALSSIPPALLFILKSPSLPSIFFVARMLMLIGRFFFARDTAATLNHPSSNQT